ncbi:cytochrome c maturation protein CcmE [Legionella birminghamensis]|nr:cytochrome c maturation protein CcmE [Legionella birminghamensis]
MNPVRRKKLTRLMFILLILGIVTALVMYALRQNISLFYTPSQVVSGEAPHQQVIRLGGMVAGGSIVRSSEDLSVQFELTDFNQKVIVHYKGILPDLFRENQGIVTKGFLLDDGQFKATEVLAKHDANYMPPEVKAGLAKTKRSIS